MQKVIVWVDTVAVPEEPGAVISDLPASWGLLLDLACALANQAGGRVQVLSIIEAGPDESLSTVALAAQGRRQGIAAWNRAWLAAYEAVHSGSGLPMPDIQVVVSVAAAGGVWPELGIACRGAAGDLLLAAALIPTAPINGLLILQHDLPCDSALIRPPTGGEAARMSGGAPLDVARVLVPARGGPHAGLALRLAGALVAGRGATLTLLHVLQQDLPERQRTREERPFRALLAGAGLPADTGQVWAVGRSVGETILQQAGGYRLLLLGAPTGSTSDELRLGRVAAAVLRHAEAAVVIVRTAAAAEPAIQALLQAHGGGDTALAPEALSLVVDKWFAENTFHSDEYADLAALVELKRQRGVTISLGLPTLNEEATIGEIIRVLRTALMDEVPLLDEIVVIDSQSQDRTVEIARALGVPVVVHQELLPEAGPALRGKGEALWKSLHVLKGDLIAWVDTDIANMHPRFVYGLLGPLLHEPRIAYVKGYYHRPLLVGDILQHEGGGRVTELTVRPLFNLFFPLLSGLVQPLAGEYAGRREVLERLPFFSGYGVETGLLIDLLEEYGLSAIGQVSLGERVHRNQSLSNLSLMAFALVQVILSRMEEHARVQFIQDVNRSMKLIRFAPGQLALEVREVGDQERPPIRTIPAYRKARARERLQ